MKEFIEKLKEKYNISELKDWERISGDQIRSSGGPKEYSLKTMLKIAYPDENFSSLNFSSRSKKSSQRWLAILIQELFTPAEVIEDAIIPSGIEVDIWVPKYSLAIEYHGHQHFIDSPHYGPLELYQIRDETKIQLCKENNIKLLVIPFWWDNKKDSLHKTIFNEFPSIIDPPKNENVKPISKSPIFDKLRKKTISPFSRDNIISNLDNINVENRFIRFRQGVFARWNGNSLVNQHGKEFTVPEYVPCLNTLSKINQFVTYI